MFYRTDNLLLSFVQVFFVVVCVILVDILVECV